MYGLLRGVRHGAFRALAMVVVFHGICFASFGGSKTKFASSVLAVRSHIIVAKYCGDSGLSTLVITSYMGVEGIAITAGEAERPETTIPRAMRSMVFRLILFTSWRSR